jgi:hypothetical protein
MSQVDFSKLLDHPNCEDIVSKLISGTKPKDVAEWLRLKYLKPEEAHLRLSVKLLKEFVDGNIDLYNVVKNDVIAVQNGEKVERKIAKSLLNNKSYQERLVEIADTELNIKQEAKELIHIIKSRVEQVFDKIQENPHGFKGDYILINYMKTLNEVLGNYDKIVNQRPDITISQQNINVNVFNDYAAILQDAVRETLALLEPEVAFKFMDLLNSKMSKLASPSVEPQLSQSERVDKIELLGTKIEKLGVNK